jgi:hypothetical protein
VAVAVRDPYCERSASLGSAFPDLAGGVAGLAFGLVRGTMLTARRLLERQMWASEDWPARGGRGGYGTGGCGCGCTVVHRYVVSDCSPWSPCCGGCGCGCCG